MRSSGRWLLAVVSVLMISAGMVTGAEIRTAESYSPEFKKIFKEKKIVVAMLSSDEPPFFMHDSLGKLTGIDVELATAIARSLDVELVLNRTAKTFDDVVRLIAQKEADIAISYLSRTSPRGLSVLFTQPYMRFKHALLINRLKAKKSDSLEWFNRKEVTIGVLEGSAYVDFGKMDFPQATLAIYPSWDSAATAVQRGDIHAALMDDNEVLSWTRRHPEVLLYIQTRVLANTEDQISMATHWQNTHLLAWLNLNIEFMEAEGRLNQLRQKYLVKKAP